MHIVATIGATWRDKLLLYLKDFICNSKIPIDNILNKINDKDEIIDPKWKYDTPIETTAKGIFNAIGLQEKHLKQTLNSVNSSSMLIAKKEGFSQRSGEKVDFYILTKKGWEEAKNREDVYKEELIKQKNFTPIKEVDDDFFKKQVAQIFEVAGYEVKGGADTSNRGIKFEMLAEKKDLVKTSIMIDTYKSEQKLTEDDLQLKKFISKFKAAKRKNIVNAAVFVHSTGFTKNAYSLSNESDGVKLLTLEELTTNLFNMSFKSYLEQCIKDFEDSSLCKTYVSALFENITYDKVSKLKNSPSTIKEGTIAIDDYISEWIIKNDNKQICVLGEYRMGKTSFSKHFMYIQAKRYINNEDNRVPIYVDLKSYRKTKDIYKTILNSLEERGVKIDIGDFKKLMQLGKFVLILDGFDEMIPGGDENVRAYAFAELTKCIVPGVKVIITCRPNYFIGIKEIKQIKNGKISQSVPDIIESKELQFDILYLKPLNKDKIEEYLERPSIKKSLDKNELDIKTVEEIIFINNLEDLIKSPNDLLFLIRILISSGVKTHYETEVKIGELYDNWFTDLIKREYQKKIDVNWSIDEEDKKRFFEDLSWYMFTAGKYEISYSELDNKIRERFNLDNTVLKHYTSDIRTGPFMTIKDESISFDVGSIREFLVAKKFIREINENDPKKFDKIKITKVIANFIRDLHPNVQNLWEWIHNTKGMSFEKVNFRGGNAATLLNVMGEKLTNIDFSDTVLVGADFSYADLSNSMFNGTKLKEANLIYSNLSNCKFINTSLDDSNFLGIGEVHSVAWSPNGRYIACAGENNFIIVFEKIKYENTIKFKESAILHGHNGRINSLKWSSDGKRIITGSSDGTVKVWDIHLGFYIMSFPCHAGGIENVQLVEEGKKIIALCKLNKLIILDVDSGTLSDSIYFKCGQVKSIVSTKDGKFTFIGNSNGIISILNTDLNSKNAKEILWMLQGDKLAVTSLCLSPDEKSLFSGTVSGRITMWRVENSGNIYHKIWTSEAHDAHREAVTCLIISNDNSKLVSGGKDKRIKLWDIRRFKIIDNIIEYDGSIESIGFSPNEDCIVSGGLDGSLKIWNIMSESDDFCRAIQRIKLVCENMVLDGASGIGKNGIEFLLQRGANMPSHNLLHKY